MDILSIFLIIIVIFLLIAISWIWPPNSPWAPWWRTKSKTAEKALRLAKVNSKDLVYELGSGEATALVVAAEKFGATGVGIEIDPIRCFLSRLTIKRKKLDKKIIIKKKSFFEENLKDADVVYVYLVPKALEKLIPKFKKELKKGTRIISYKYKLSLEIKKEDKENNLSLYVI